MSFEDDTVLVIDSKTGCMFVGDILIHSDTCVCDYDYDSYKDSL